MVDVITVDDFRQAMTQFADENIYSDEMVELSIDRAHYYITGDFCPRSWRGYALKLMTAHLLTISDRIMKGDASAGGRITSTSIDKISVSLDAPQSKNDFEYWLSLTPYGLELLSLLRSKAPAGIYSGGKNYRVFR